MVKLFLSYSHKDEELRNELETHLALLKRQGVISSWHDRRITAGSDINEAIHLGVNIHGRVHCSHGIASVILIRPR